VRANVAADLEDDLGVPPQRDRSHVASPGLPRDVRVHMPPEAGEARAPQRLAPDAEQVAHCRSASRHHFDDTRRRRRPECVRASRAQNVGAVSDDGRRHPDPRGQEKDATVREELDMRTGACVWRRCAVEPSDRSSTHHGRRRGRKPVPRADADRRRNRRSAAQHTQQCDDDRSTKHTERIDARFAVPAR